MQATLRKWGMAAGLVAALGVSGCAQSDIEPTVRAAAFSGQGETSARRHQAASPMAYLARLIGAQKSAGPSLAVQQKLGDALAAKMLGKVRVSDDKALDRKARSIITRLSRAPSAAGMPWHVYVIKDARANAFTTGGGHIFISDGMMKILRDEDMIAAVVAHEMGHNILSHVIQAQRKKAETRDMHRYSREVLGKRMKLDWLGSMVSFLATTSLNRYSRNQEDEADAKGMEIMVDAGYDPNAALRTFDRLSGIYRDEPELVNFFYGNHPTYRYRRWHLVNLIRAHFRQQAGLPPVRRANYGARRKPAAPMRPDAATARPEEPAASRPQALSAPEGLW